MRSLGKIESLKKTYRRASVVQRSILWFTGCQFAQKGISLVTVPVFTRLLSKDEYGMWSMYFSWVTLLTIIVSFSINRVLLNALVKYKDVYALESASIGLSLLLTFLWLVLYVLFLKDISIRMHIVPQIGVMIILFAGAQSIYSCWLVIRQYQYKYKEAVIVTLIYSLLGLGIGAAAVIGIDATAEMRFLPQAAVMIVICIVIFVKTLLHSKCLYNREIWKFLLGFSIPLLPHYLSETILQCSDRIMIERMCSAAEAAEYSIAYSVGGLIGVVTSSINAAFSPYQYQKLNEKKYNELSDNANKVIGIVSFSLCLLMFFSRRIVLIFGGYQYSESDKVIIPVCLGIYFSYIYQLFARVQEYYAQKKTIATTSVLCAGLNLLLNFFCIPIYGYQAAAYTTFACYLFFCILHYVYYRKTCAGYIGREIYNIKAILMLSIAPMFVGVVMLLIA